MRRDYLCASDYWGFGASDPCVYGGGNYNRNVNHGLFYLNYNSASNSNGNIGSRLLLGNFYPKAKDFITSTGFRVPLGKD